MDKKLILEKCQELLNEQHATLLKRLEDLQESKSNETKSSAGDKFETGRSMMHLEEEKIGRELLRVKKQIAELHRIELDQTSEAVQLGSLVKTSVGVYFMSIGLGRIKIDGTSIFCISFDSPIGKLLKNKTKGDEIEFNGMKQVIKEIV